jgi:hypothetical protein
VQAVDVQDDGILIFPSAKQANEANDIVFS